MHPWIWSLLFVLPLLALRVLVSYWINRRRYNRLQEVKARNEARSVKHTPTTHVPLRAERRQVACEVPSHPNFPVDLPKYNDHDVHSETYRVILESDAEDPALEEGDQSDSDPSSSSETGEVEGDVTPRPPELRSGETELEMARQGADSEVPEDCPPTLVHSSESPREEDDPKTERQPHSSEQDTGVVASECDAADVESKGDCPDGQNPDEGLGLSEPGDATELVEDFERSDEAAVAAKEDGNSHYKAGDYEAAVMSYNKALNLTPSANPKLAATILGNIAAVYFTQGKHEECIQACDDCIEVDKEHVKARVRRYKANRAMKKYHDALSDLQLALDLDPTLRPIYRNDLETTEKLSKEQFDKEKDEMIGKMKEFANWGLGKLGMKIDDFKMVQDPATGSYNIQYAPPGQVPTPNAAGTKVDD